jgi:hypothetical protein
MAQPLTTSPALQLLFAPPIDSDEKNVYQWMIAGAQLTWVF